MTIEWDSSSWDYPQPFISRIIVADDVIDRMGHANNTAYVQWFEVAAWAHTEALGLGWEVYQRLNRGFVARETRIQYLRPALAGETLLVATWIARNDQRLSMTRHYQIVREQDGETLVRGDTDWVCVALDSGKPKRMPEEFVRGYPAPDAQND